MTRAPEKTGAFFIVLMEVGYHYGFEPGWSRDMDEGSSTILVEIRIPTAMHAAFGKIAEALERDHTQVMLRAFRNYLETEGGDILREADGLAALARGEGVDFDAVMDDIDGIIANAEARHAPMAKGAVR